MSVIMNWMLQHPGWVLIMGIAQAMLFYLCCWHPYLRHGGSLVVVIGRWWRRSLRRVSGYRGEETQSIV